MIIDVNAKHTYNYYKQCIVYVDIISIMLALRPQHKSLYFLANLLALKTSYNNL